ncbi:MAG: hypothetical protein K5930_12510 [Treponemataceae bacterium]|nr:hypothetical protein [Treponemataceae bacterium]
MKKTVLAVCLIGLLLIAFSGCGLLKTEVVLQNTCSGYFEVTVTCAGETQTVNLPANQEIAVPVKKGEEVRISYPTKDSNNNNVYSKKTGSDPITWKFSNQVIY